VAKVKGPLFSVDAWGNFGNMLVFQRRRRQAVVYPYTVPANPNTGSQQGVRASFAGATSSWNVLPPASKVLWWAKAQGARLSGYNMYVQNYLLGLLGEPPEPPEPPVEAEYLVAVMALNPVAYWRMGEASGNLVDSSGNGNTAVAYGTAAYGVAGAISGDSDKAVSFDGDIGDNFKAVNSGSINTGDVFSIVAWVKKSADGYYMNIAEHGGGGYFFRILGSNYLALHKRDTADIVFSTVVITGTDWHMVAAVKNGATSAKLYIDGVDRSDTVTDATILATGSPVGIATVDGWRGTLDEIAIFATALSGAEILALYELGMGS